jgi:hypothetical protein
MNSDATTLGDNEMTVWKIESYEVTEEQAKTAAMRAAFSFSSRGRYTPAGTYRRLMRDGTVIMSDTPDEIRDLSEFRRRATGKVLINGLGLGLAMDMALAKPDVTHVTVIEIAQEVIDLLPEPYRRFGDRLQINCADAFSWRPFRGERFDVVWHDIWDNICADNLPEMTRLHRKYGKLCNWQGSWCRAQCRSR